MFSIEFIEGAFRAPQMPLEIYRVEDWAKGTSIYTPPYFRSLSCTCPVSHRCFSCTYPVLILNSFGIHQVLMVCPLANLLSILYIRLLSCISPFNILLMSAQDPVYIRFILYMFVTDSVTGQLQDETWYIANTLRTSTGYVKYKTDIYRKRTAFFCPVISVTTFEHVQNSLPYMPDIDWHGTHLTDDNSIYTVYIPYFNGYQRTGKKGVRFLSVSSIRWYVTGPLGQTN